MSHAGEKKGRRIRKQAHWCACWKKTKEDAMPEKREKIFSPAQLGKGEKWTRP